MGLLISWPSVFVWGPEVCLSTVFVVCWYHELGNPCFRSNMIQIGNSVEWFLLGRNFSKQSSDHGRITIIVIMHAPHRTCIERTQFQVDCFQLKAARIVSRFCHAQWYIHPPPPGGGGALDFHVAGGVPLGRKPDPVAMRSVHKNTPCHNGNIPY